MQGLEPEKRPGEGDKDSDENGRRHKFRNVKPRSEPNNRARRVAGLHNCGKVARNGLGFVCRCKLNEGAKNPRRHQNPEGRPDGECPRVANGRDEFDGGDEQERGSQLSEHKMGSSPIPQIEEFFFRHGAILPRID